MLPIIGLRRWRSARKFVAITDHIDRAIGARPCVVYPCTLEKTGCEAEAELERLLMPDNGFGNWCDFIESHPDFVPAIITEVGDDAAILEQVRSLVQLRRPLCLRLVRDEEWQTHVIELLSGIDFGGLPLLVVFDYGQIYPATNIPLVAATLVGLARTCRSRFPSADMTFVIAASSFPVEFASIDRATARLPIRERQLFELISNQIGAEARLAYSDYASVYAGVRGFSQGGAPRVDYPTKTRWVYYRRDVGTFADAAVSVMADPAWDDHLLIWGTERIRQAAGGDLTDLHYAGAWTGVRIHLHMHQQIHFGGPPGAEHETEELWED